MAVDEKKNILVDNFAIIAKNLIQEKIKKEKVYYNKLIEKGNVIVWPSKVIDEDFVINFISKLKKEYENNNFSNSSWIKWFIKESNGCINIFKRKNFEKRIQI